MEDRALSLSLSSALRDLRDQDSQVHAGVLNRQGGVYRTIAVDGMRQYHAFRDGFSRLGYTNRFGDDPNLSLFAPPSNEAWDEPTELIAGLSDHSGRSTCRTHSCGSTRGRGSCSAVEAVSSQPAPPLVAL